MKKKLSLKDVKVQSFTTSTKVPNVNTVKGGFKLTTRTSIIGIGGGGIDSHSGVCICDSEDCETEVVCDLTQGGFSCYADMTINC